MPVIYTFEITADITVVTTPFQLLHANCLLTEIKLQGTRISVRNIPGNAGRNKTGLPL
jgi:hypothetical protein